MAHLINITHRFNRGLNTPLFLALCILALFCLISLPAFAGTLSEDLREARNLVTGNLSDGPFWRGMLYPLFHPTVLSSLFCIGLWAGLSSDRLSTIWAIPIAFFIAIVIGAFISEYHPQWRPDFTSLREEYPELPPLLSTTNISLAIALVMGAIVAMNFTLPPLITLIVIAILGVILGSSDLALMDSITDRDNIIIPFWAGFGITGLIMTIFGIGFETFTKSVNMAFLIRLSGFFTAVLALIMAVKSV
jgi:hydrogenase/urease accessory protein HupE